MSFLPTTYHILVGVSTCQAVAGEKSPDAALAISKKLAWQKQTAATLYHAILALRHLHMELAMHAGAYCTLCKPPVSNASQFAIPKCIAQENRL